MASSFFSKRQIILAAALFVLFAFTGCDAIADLLPDDFPMPGAEREQGTPGLPPGGGAVVRPGGGITYEPEGQFPVISPGDVRMPATGRDIISHGGITLDLTSTSEGVIIIRTDDPQTRTAVDVSNIQTGSMDRFFLNPNAADGDILPLLQGTGEYSIRVLTEVANGMFSLVMSETFDVSVDNHLSPFLLPNQYADFRPGSRVVVLAAEIAGESSSRFDFVRRVYDYIITNISYDHNFAAAVIQGEISQHVPNPDETLRRGVGVCFDYASLMAAMLRSQGVPARIEIGWVQDIYHAWISVYAQGVGWINFAQFSATNNWILLDPTTTAGNPGGGFTNPIVAVSSYNVTRIR